jgi:hypothetical protein
MSHDRVGAGVQKSVVLHYRHKFHKWFKSIAKQLASMFDDGIAIPRPSITQRYNDMEVIKTPVPCKKSERINVIALE